jgi:hypothetical protein
MMKRGSRDGTKRDLIAKMLLDKDHELSVEQIAAELGTTKGNVLKEKSILRSMGIFQKRNIGVFSGTAEGDIFALSRSETRMLVPQTNYGSLIEIPPLGIEELKLLYSEFKRGKGPSDVLAEHGFHPSLVEYEHRRFMRLNNLDIHAVLVNVISKIGLQNNKMFANLLHEIEKNGIPSTNVLLQVFEAVREWSFLEGEKSVVNRIKAGEPVPPYRHLECGICHMPILGAVIDETSEMGQQILQAVGRPVHSRCNMGGLRTY